MTTLNPNSSQPSRVNHSPESVGRYSPSTAHAFFHCSLCFLTASLVALAIGCAPISGRVQVFSRTRTHSIEEADSSLFVGDRASHLRFPSRELLPKHRRQEFFVRWSHRDTRSVKFEYRQVNEPTTIHTQVLPVGPTGLFGGSTVFTIAGTNCITGGAVSAWQVTILGESDAVLARRQSTLW